MRISRNRKTISPPEFFLSGESRRPNRLFRLASTFSFLSLSSLPFAPQLPLHAPAVFCNLLASITRRKYERVSFFFAQSRSIHIYVHVHVHEYRSKYKEREKKGTRRRKWKKKRQRKKGSTLESFYLRLLSSLFCARQDETFRSITNETVFVSRCRSFEIAPSMLGSEPFLPDNVPTRIVPNNAVIFRHNWHWFMDKYTDDNTIRSRLLIDRLKIRLILCSWNEYWYDLHSVYGIFKNRHNLNIEKKYPVIILLFWIK